MLFPRIATAATIGWLTVAGGAVATAQSTAETVDGNDNRRPAGILADGALTVRIYAARGEWHPEREEGPALNVAAFGEEGGPLVTPGPLLRVSEGTDLIVRVRNTLAERLSIHGFVTRPANDDTVFTVEPGQTREIRFAAGAPGTYHYWADTAGSALNRRRAVESQLGGAFIVDPRGSVPTDRVFVMTEWDDSELLVDEVVDARTRRVFAINGRSWPHTERLDEQVGRPANWRIVNLTQVGHPMHLHGFYFSVRSIGTGLRQTTYAPDEYRTVVTEPVPAGRTVQLSWTPERAGNWLLHCHMIAHATPALRFWAPATQDHGHATHAAHDATTGMAGLVMGIRVSGRNPEAATPGVAPPRQLTLAMHRRPGHWGPEDAYGFALASGTNAPGPENVSVPGPVLVLTRGEPVEIVLKNELPEATAIHWHGIELDSYYDGVPGWGGDGVNTTPAIEPGGSLRRALHTATRRHLHLSHALARPAAARLRAVRRDRGRRPRAGVRLDSRSRRRAWYGGHQGYAALRPVSCCRQRTTRHRSDDEGWRTQPAAVDQHHDQFQRAERVVRLQQPADRAGALSRRTAPTFRQASRSCGRRCARPSPSARPSIS